MSLEHLVAPESKEMLKKKKKKKDSDTSEGHRSQLKELPKLEHFKQKQTQQQQNVLLDYNPKYKINIREFILIETI